MKGQPLKYGDIIDCLGYELLLTDSIVNTNNNMYYFINIKTLYVHPVDVFTMLMCGYTVVMSSPKIYTGPLTQEEIDEIIESYNNSVPGIIPQNTGVGSSSNISFEYADEDNLVIRDGWHEYDEGWYNNSPPACRHKWKKYVGLSQSFEYCEICDKKKDDV